MGYRVALSIFCLFLPLLEIEEGHSVEDHLCLLHCEHRPAEPGHHLRYCDEIVTV